MELKAHEPFPNETWWLGISNGGCLSESPILPSYYARALPALPSLHSSGLNFVFLHSYYTPYGYLPHQLPSKILATQTFAERSPHVPQMGLSHCLWHQSCLHQVQVAKKDAT